MCVLSPEDLPGERSALDHDDVALERGRLVVPEE
jgi:hypothetical protein